MGLFDKLFGKKEQKESLDYFSWRRRFWLHFKTIDGLKPANQAR